MRVLHVSDSHLAPGVPYGDANWAAVVEHAATTRPDLVVHTGDITLDGAVDPAQLAYARGCLDDLPVPWVAIPGNHDLGDFDDPVRPIDDERRTLYAAAFGDDRWSHDLGGWRLVGFDVQTLASDLGAAGALAEWVAAELSRPGPTALFIHRPLRPWGGADDNPHRYVNEPWRTRLDELVRRHEVRLVASGHVHQSLAHDHDGVRHVWAPSSWAALPDYIQPVIGVKQTGVVELGLGADGAVDHRFVRPQGMADVVGGVDFASPYGAH